MRSLTVTRGVALGGALTLLHARAAIAATATHTPSGEQTPLDLGAGSGGSHHSSGSASSGIVRTVVGLAIVIAVIYGVSWILRQAKSAKTRPLGQGLQQVANLPLGSGKSVSLVRVGSDVVLLGVGEHGVTKIRFYSEDEALEAGLHPDVDLPDAEPAVLTPVERAIDALRRMTVRS